MKVLIISHNPITTYQNMGKTMLSLFCEFDKSELCQLYCYPTMPDISFCESYYRVTDRDVLNSYGHFGHVQSRVIMPHEINTCCHSMYESDEDARIYKKHKRNALTLLLRDAMWACSTWYNSDLKTWLAKEKPTCIFLAPGDSKFIYDIALRISKELGIGIVTYICDEYYFVNNAKGLIPALQLALLRKKMKKTLVQSKKIVTICDELATAYKEEFGTPTHTIQTGAGIPIADRPKPYREIRKITYMGNLSCERFRSLADIGRELDVLNATYGTDYQLEIFSTPFKENIQKIFSEVHSIRYAGYVTGDEFKHVLQNTQVLLHVEAFDPQSKERVKNSVSTKIADSLSSGAVLLAYGPEEIASMQHLMRNQCALTVTSRENLKEALLHLFQDANVESVVENALLTARKYHIKEQNSLKLRGLLCEQET